MLNEAESVKSFSASFLDKSLVMIYNLGRNLKRGKYENTWLYSCDTLRCALSCAFHIAYKLGMPKKYTRKLVHIAVGFEWVILYGFFGAGLHSLIVCLIFLTLLIVAYFKKLLPTISSDSDNAPGTVYYAASMSVIALVSIFLPDIMLPFGVAVLCTSFGDGLAGVVGQLIKKYNPRILGEKTLLGALSNFAVCFLGTILFAIAFEFKISVTDCLAIAIFSTTLELITPHGLDNVSVPLGTVTLAYILAYIPAFDGYVLPIALTPLIIAIVLNRRVLTPLGTTAAIILDIAVSVAFKNAGFAVLLSFLALSVISDFIKKGREADKDVSSKPRDEMQVIANGAAALVCAVAYIFEPIEAFAFAFVAVMAEALADTVSSAFGAFAKNTLDLFRMKKCQKGLSGGVSIPGTLAALAGAFLIPTLAFLLGLITPIHILPLGAIAFGGTFIDTFIGSLLQEKYRCKKCGRLTDSKLHCSKQATRVSGFSFIDNNTTNLVSNVAVAIIVILIFM